MKIRLGCGALVVLMAGCEGATPTAAVDSTTAAAPAAPASATASPTASSRSEAAPSASVKPKVFALTAVRAFLDAAGAKFGKLKALTVHTEKTDPNKLLGRPGQYLAKMSWTIDGGDATIEGFPDGDGAKARADRVRAIGKASPMFLEYVYVHPTKHLVLRVPKALTPTDAGEWEKVLLSL